MLLCRSVASQPWSSPSVGRIQPIPGRNRAPSIPRKLWASHTSLLSPFLPSCLFGKMILTAPTMLLRDPHLQPRDWLICESHHPARKSEGWISHCLGTLNHGIFPLLQPQAEPAFPLGCTTLRAWNPSGLCYSEEPLLLPHRTSPRDRQDQGGLCSAPLCAPWPKLPWVYIRPTKTSPGNPSFACPPPPCAVKECLSSICH